MIGKQKWIGFAALFCGVLLFSTIEVASKYIEADVPPLRLAFFRFFITGIVLMPAAIRLTRKSHIVFSWRDVAILTALGFAGVTLTIGVYHLAIPRMQANAAAIVFSCNPVFVILFSHLILSEKLTRRKIAAIAISLAGVFILVGAKEGPDAPDVLSGVLLMGLAAILFALYTVLFKKFVPRYGATTITAFAGLAGSLFLLPVSFLTEGGISLSYGLTDWAGIIYLAVFCTALAYFLYIYGISHVEASWGSMTFFLKPLFAAIFAWLILGETLTAGIVAGGMLIMLSVLLAVFQKPSKT
ncbi:MAG: EamA family transporter [Kiritimatiellales bacterium]|nr:EamA family transporter [Kiritimatiellales bacterium]